MSIDQILNINLSPRIITAYEFAQKAHGARTRFSGAPYLNHVVETANILLGWLSPQMLTLELEDLIIAGLLHDTIEYEQVSPKVIQKKFGTLVRNLVVGLSDFRSDGDPKLETENLRIIAHHGYADPRIFVIKLADRLHNMRTHQFLPTEKQIPKALETMNIYVPLAESLGMWIVKKELEDICFSYLYPEIYIETKNKISKDSRITKTFDNKYTKIFTNILGAGNYTISFDTNGLWTIYNKKLQAQNLGVEENNGFSHIDDIKTASIVIHSEDDTKIYSILGKIHTSKLSSLIEPKKINDYIAIPKPNKYSSLQSILNLPEGKLEVNIVTKSKKEFNDWGILSFVRKGHDLSVYKHNIIFDESHFARFMPLKSTYLDYVYKLGIGPFAKKVNVNGIPKPLSHQCRNGSIVGVVLSQKIINRGNLKSNFPETKNLIDLQNNLMARDKLIIKGREIIEKILIPRGLLNLNDVTKARNSVIHTLLLKDTNELCFRVAIGDISLEEVSKILDRNKITKSHLRLSTLRISGKNKPGVLSIVTELINKLGGNIYHITSPRPLERISEDFTLRILLKGISQKKALQIKSTLSKNPAFDKVEIY